MTRGVGWNRCLVSQQLGLDGTDLMYFGSLLVCVVVDVSSAKAFYEHRLSRCSDVIGDCCSLTLRLMTHGLVGLCSMTQSSNEVCKQSGLLFMLAGCSNLARDSSFRPFGQVYGVVGFVYLPGLIDYGIHSGVVISCSQRVGSMNSSKLT